MPLVSKSFSDIITFTRASTATYFDSAGVLQSAAIDVPRFDYNPATLAAQGLLIEEQRTNLVTYSEDILSWTNAAGATFSSTAATAPDGTTTANSIVENNASASRRAWIGVTTVASATYTVSCFIKALPGSAQRYVRLILWDPALTNGYAVLFCNPNTGTVTGTNLSANAVADGWSNLVANAVQDCGNGWYRFSMTVTTGAGTALRVQNAVVDVPGATFTGGTGGALNYTGDGSSGALVWGAQLEAGSFSTSYIPTTTTALTRSADVASVNTLSPWFNAAEGTLYVEAQSPAVTGIYFYYSLNNGTTNEIRLASSSSGNNPTFVVTNSSSSQASIANILAAGTPFKAASAYATNSFNSSVNTSIGVDDTSGTPPVATSFRLGARSNDTLYVNGYLRRITYYPRRLSNAELVSITS